MCGRVTHIKKGGVMVFTGEKAAEYAREWRRKNKERSKEHDRRKREKQELKDPGYAARKTQKWREDNPEKAKETAKRNYENFKKNPEAVARARARQAEWRKRPDIIEKNRAYNTAWAKKHRTPEIVRKRALKHNYGLTPEEYDAKLQSQNGVCVLCSSPPKRTQLHVDHDHLTGTVRGLLCSNCNTGIGLLKDDPDRLVGAAEYIRSYRT